MIVSNNIKNIYDLIKIYIHMLDELQKAHEMRLRHGHNDTCQKVLFTTVQYPCNCGFDLMEDILGTKQQNEIIT